jgi:hypothetical protein
MGRQSIGRHIFRKQASQSGTKDNAMLNELVSKNKNHRQKQNTLLKFVITLQKSGRHDRVQPIRATFLYKQRTINDDQSKSPQMAGMNVIHHALIVPVPNVSSSDTPDTRRRPECTVSAKSALVACPR